MAMTTNLPPQAYTRDTLVKAIEWISHQPPAVRERASSADLIVSFYLSARRRMTAAQMEAPVSGEVFKQDLKHLAQDLKQFEEPSSAPPTQAPNRALSHGFETPSQETPTHPSLHGHLHTGHPTHQHSQQHVHLHVQHAPQPQPPPPTVPPPAPSVNKGPVWSIDSRSLSFAREIQDRFNLSSEGEALRMLVALGIERAREMFPS